MSEIVFLSIAALAAALKAMAVIVGLLWAFRRLAAGTAPVAYRCTRAELPFRPAHRRR